MDQSNGTRARVERLVCEILNRNLVTRSPTPSDALIDIGLSSIDLVNVMLGVEAEFDITIPQAELDINNFRSISTITKLLERLVI